MGVEKWTSRLPTFPHLYYDYGCLLKQDISTLQKYRTFLLCIDIIYLNRFTLKINPLARPFNKTSQVCETYEVSTKMNYLQAGFSGRSAE